MKTLEEFNEFYQQNFAEPNSELNQKLNFFRAKAIRFYLFGLLTLIFGALFWVGFTILNYNFDELSGFAQTLIIILNIVLLIVFSLFVGFGVQSQEKYQSIFKDKVIRKIIDFIDPNLKYFPKHFISKETFKSVNFFPTSRIDEYSGDDLVEGTIDKTRIMFSEINVKEKRKSGNRSYYITIFKGLFVVADFNKNFSGRTYVMPDVNDKTYSRLFLFGERRQTEFGELVKLENPEFEKMFAVFSTDQIEARYILSTSLMERMVNLRKNIGRKVYICFANSLIYLAIPFNRNLFEPRLWRKTIEFSLLKTYFEILLDTIGIVDELKLNTRIWSKA